MGKTVYVFGAGASKAFSDDFPIMKGFVRHGDLADLHYLNEFIRKRFPNTKLDDLNIEDVITCLELSLDRVGSFGRSYDGHILDARREFDKLVASRLAIPEGKSSDLHELLMGKDIAGVDCNDTIITVNYDLVIDRTLFNCSPKEEGRRECLLKRMYYLLAQPPVYGGHRPSLLQAEMQVGFYLKLHGSLDWLYCPNQECPHHREFFANKMGVDAIHNKPGDPCKMCGSALVSVLVPPTMMKSFTQFPKLGLLWSLAHRELSTADRIVVFGLSFAASDYYLRWLFRSAITERASQPEIFNINKDTGTSGKAITELTGIQPVGYQTVDEYNQQIAGLGKA